MKIASVLLLTLLVCTLAMVESEEEGIRRGLPQRRCPRGWTRYRRKCFKFQLNEKNWASAEQFCNRRGGHLASYHSRREYRFLRRLIVKAAGHNKRTWVGGTDAVRDGMWMWNDGSFFNFANWASGEPNNHRGREDCMEINLRGRNYVNDESCKTRNSFICSKRR